MTLKSSISDAVFRVKLYIGSAALGGGITALLWPLYRAGWPDADIIQIFHIVHRVFSADPTTSWLMVACGAGLSFWLVWMLVARPWRGDDGPPAARAGSVKKPW